MAIASILTKDSRMRVVPHSAYPSLAAKPDALDHLAAKLNIKPVVTSISRPGSGLLEPKRKLWGTFR
jgi:hypothetical protein